MAEEVNIVRRNIEIHVRGFESAGCVNVGEVLSETKLVTEIIDRAIKEASRLLRTRSEQRRFRAPLAIGVSEIPKRKLPAKTIGMEWRVRDSRGRQAFCRVLVSR
jgi:hypothetical protein